MSKTINGLNQKISEIENNSQKYEGYKIGDVKLSYSNIIDPNWIATGQKVTSPLFWNNWMKNNQSAALFSDKSSYEQVGLLWGWTSSSSFIPFLIFEYQNTLWYCLSDSDSLQLRKSNNGVFSFEKYWRKNYSDSFKDYCVFQNRLVFIARSSTTEATIYSVYLDKHDTASFSSKTAPNINISTSGLESNTSIHLSCGNEYILANVRNSLLAYDASFSPIEWNITKTGFSAENCCIKCFLDTYVIAWYSASKLYIYWAFDALPTQGEILTLGTKITSVSIYIDWNENIYINTNGGTFVKRKTENSFSSLDYSVYFKHAGHNWLSSDEKMCYQPEDIIQQNSFGLSYPHSFSYQENDTAVIEDSYIYEKNGKLYLFGEATSSRQSTTIQYGLTGVFPQVDINNVYSYVKIQ